MIGRKSSNCRVLIWEVKMRKVTPMGSVLPSPSNEINCIKSNSPGDDNCKCVGVGAGCMKTPCVPAFH